jgi:hypothetical protein
VKLAADQRVIQIWTNQGESEAVYGDWIIKGPKGEYYPCKHEVFELTYELAG